MRKLKYVPSKHGFWDYRLSVSYSGILPKAWIDMSKLFCSDLSTLNLPDGRSVIWLFTNSVFVTFLGIFKEMDFANGVSTCLLCHTQIASDFYFLIVHLSV